MWLSFLSSCDAEDPIGISASLVVLAGSRTATVVTYAGCIEDDNDSARSPHCRCWPFGIGVLGEEWLDRRIVLVDQFLEWLIRGTGCDGDGGAGRAVAGPNDECSGGGAVVGRYLNDAGASGGEAPIL